MPGYEGNASLTWTMISWNPSPTLPVSLIEIWSLKPIKNKIGPSNQVKHKNGPSNQDEN